MSALPIDESKLLPSLIDQLLAEQQSVAAVETFTRRHDEGELSSDLKVYEERIPLDLSELRSGQQLAFQVDLDSCTGCKACVTACHSMNGLAADEIWRDVGLVVGSGSGGVQQAVTTACHHCEDPACLSGCPVMAYEKDPVTGIVRHLDDQCIGCQYCVLKCPYDVPKFSEELKIVRKCDMCAGRLAVGESPACVQGCPTNAISIAIVDRNEDMPANELLLGFRGVMPDSSITRPTTRYLSKRPTTAMEPSDMNRVSPGQAHDPLAIMLVLLQLSVGVLGIGLAAWLLGLTSGSALCIGLSLAAGTAALGLGAATMHLGRPLYAFRAFLGWRTSWMSREILVIGAYVPAVAMAALAALVVEFGDALVLESPLVSRLASEWLPGLQTTALFTGVVGMACSMMIYIDTRRLAWSFSRTVPLFIGTSLVLGAFGVAVAIVIDGVLRGIGTFAPAIPFFALGLTLLGAKLWMERAFVETAEEGASDSSASALVRGARLMRGPLRQRSLVRVALAGFGALGATALIASVAGASAPMAAALSIGTLLSVTFGEFIERHLYFTAEASPGMPGH